MLRSSHLCVEWTVGFRPKTVLSLAQHSSPDGRTIYIMSNRDSRVGGLLMRFHVVTALLCFCLSRKNHMDQRFWIVNSFDWDTLIDWFRRYNYYLNEEWNHRFSIGWITVQLECCYIQHLSRISTPSEILEPLQNNLWIWSHPVIFVTGRCCHWDRLDTGIRPIRPIQATLSIRC